MAEKVSAERLAQAEEIAEKLLCAPVYYFSELKPSELTDGLAVVYAIFDILTGETLYVGRTKNLRQRLYYNHLMGPKSNARLKKYLTEDPNMPSIQSMEEAKRFLRERCCFRFLPESDMRTRGQVEGLLSFLLDVRYIHEEH